MKRITKCKSKHGERGLLLSLMCAGVVATSMAGCAEAPYVTAHGSGYYYPTGDCMQDYVRDVWARRVAHEP
jgi:hypothetical protein